MMSAEFEGDRGPGASWGSLRLLRPLIWVLLIAALLGSLAIAVVGDVRPRVGLVVMTVLTLVLLGVIARLFLVEAHRQERRRVAAEREARELERLVTTRTRELAELSTHLQDYAEKEKAELARNLHDELGGLLTAAKMDLSWLQSRIHEAPLATRLAQLGNVLDEAMNLKRRVVEDLRPSLLDHFGLPTALRAHVEAACANAGLACELAISGEAESIPHDTAIALFRVVQEGLTNIVRHARAQHVRLALTSDAKRHLLLLGDDGCGIQAGNPLFRWSHGLAGMRHRVEALGGQFAIESSAAAGTTLRVDVPRERSGSVQAQ
jgi:signal transduction histidine kinase